MASMIVSGPRSTTMLRLDMDALTSCTAIQWTSSKLKFGSLPLECILTRCTAARHMSLIRHPPQHSVSPAPAPFPPPLPTSSHLANSLSLDQSYAADHVTSPYYLTSLHPFHPTISLHPTSPHLTSSTISLHSTSHHFTAPHPTISIPASGTCSTPPPPTVVRLSSHGSLTCMPSPEQCSPACPGG